MGAIRSIETRQMSGIAMMSEFLTLDAKLSEKAKNLELGEETIFRLFSKWQGEAWTGEIKYPMAFHIRDKNLDIDILKKAADTNPVDPRVKAAIDAKILDILEVEPEETESQDQQEEIQDPLMTEAAAAAAARDN